MFVGHYALALGAKRLAPRTSLGTLILGAQFLDLLWPILLLAGLERVAIVPGLMEASALAFLHFPISHSLLAAAGWGLLVGSAYWGLRRSWPGAAVLGLAVVSHWFLDLPMHRPDLPLWPGSEARMGWGLWNSLPATLAVEFGLLAAGLAVYLRFTRASDGIGRWGLWSMVALIAFFSVSGLFGPPPPGEKALAIVGLALWLFVPWGYWVDRHRTLRRGSGQRTPAPATREPAAI